MMYVASTTRVCGGSTVPEGPSPSGTSATVASGVPCSGAGIGVGEAFWIEGRPEMGVGAGAVGVAGIGPMLTTSVAVAIARGMAAVMVGEGSKGKGVAVASSTTRD
jgi:hypothetical protein